MLTLDPRLRYALWGLLGLLLVGVALEFRPAPSADNPAYDALSAALSRRIAADALALAAADSALAIAQGHTASTIVRYKALRDTLSIHDTVQVKVFVARADSVVRSCTELVESCATLRVRADSSIADLTLDRDRWKLQAESERPSGLSLFVRRTLPVVAFVGGVYVGSRVVR